MSYVVACEKCKVDSVANNHSQRIACDPRSISIHALNHGHVITVCDNGNYERAIVLLLRHRPRDKVVLLS